MYFILEIHTKDYKIIKHMSALILMQKTAKTIKRISIILVSKRKAIKVFYNDVFFICVYEYTNSGIEDELGYLRLKRGFGSELDVGCTLSKLFFEFFLF